MSHTLSIRVRVSGIALTTVIAASLAVSNASAAGFGIGEQSTSGTGMAYAGVAAGGSLSDMFWNPATLGEVNGFTYETDLTAVLPFVNVTSNAVPALAPAQNNGGVGLDAFVPASYAAYRVNQNIILGLGVNSPFGLATSYSPTSILALSGVASGSRIFSVDVNPDIAYQINDQLTIAAGLQGQYMELRETGLGAATGDYTGHTNNIGFGYTLGIDYKPLKGTSIGLGYRSGITNKFTGTLSGLTLAPVNGTVSLKTPGQATLGIAQDVGPQWTLRGGVEYTNWGVLNSAGVGGTAALVVGNSIPFHYKDSWMYSVGAEYKYDDKTTLRSGIAYETSPITNANRNFRLPDSDRLWLSAGISYAITKATSLDVGYAYLYGFGSTITAATAGGISLNGPFGGTFNSSVSILSVALKVKFD